MNCGQSVALAAALFALGCVAPKARPAVVAPAADPPAGPGAMASHLSTGSDGVWLIWVEPRSEASVQVRAAQWSSGAWTPAVTIADHASIVANWADTPSLGEGKDGALVAQWSERLPGDGHATRVLTARSTDRGQTWKGLGPLHDDETRTEHGFVSLATEGEAIRAFWLDGRMMQGGMGGRGAMTLRSAAIGTGVTGEEALDLSVCDCCGTAAAATARGPIVVFRDRRPGEIRDISIVRRVDGGWTPPSPVHEDGWRIAACPVNGPAIAADGDRAAVAWFTYAGGRSSVRLAFSDDAGTTFGTAFEVDGPRDRTAPIGRVAVVLDDDGSALVGWMTSNREQGEVLVRRVGRDGRRGVAVALAQTQSDRNSGFPRLVRSGRALASSWTEPGSPSRLRFKLVPLAEIPAATGDVSLPGVGAEPSLPVGSEAPAYRAFTAEGAAVALKDFRGQAVLFNFWATWCEPCRAELPELARLHQRYAARGLRIVGVSLDAQQTPEQVKAFAARRKVPYPILFDPHDSASGALGIATLPMSILIGADGRVVWSQVGAIADDDPALARAIEGALR